jgi:hypothetical protein
MSAQNNGGSAFPHDEIHDCIEPYRHIQASTGVTVRDYFAAKFIAAWVVTLGARHGLPWHSDRDAMWEAIRLGTEQADAMLAERAKPATQPAGAPP